MRFIIFVLIGAVLGQVEVRGEFELSNGIAAIADDAVITVHQVRKTAADTIELYRRTYFNNPEVFDQKRIAALTDALEALIDRQLILHDFKNLGGVIQESYIDDIIKERIREQFGDRATLIKGLQAEQITWETFRQRERDRVIESIMERKNVREGLLISPAKIEHYYQTNLPRYKVEDQVKLRKIELNRTATASLDEIHRRALEIKAKIDGGAPFSETAATYSEASDRKDGGLWGWREQRQIAKGLAEIAFALKPGECSPLVGFAREGPEAYWIIRYHHNGQAALGRKFTDKDVFVEERKFADQAGPNDLPALPNTIYLLYVEEKQSARTRALAEVRDEIEKDLLLQERARLQRKWLQRLRAKSFVRVLF
jgi:peptidyl-prolyl cis-trans isomerase SurA